MMLHHMSPSVALWAPPFGIIPLVGDYATSCGMPICHCFSKQHVLFVMCPLAGHEMWRTDRDGWAWCSVRDRICEGALCAVLVAAQWPHKWPMFIQTAVASEMAIQELNDGKELLSTVV